VLQNLNTYGGPVRGITVTAPGSDVLPCGPDGRVDTHRRIEWNVSADRRWTKLHDAAYRRTKRECGYSCSLLLRAIPFQQRGVKHVHLLLGEATERERISARVYERHLRELASQYGFGRVHGDGGRHPGVAGSYIVNNFVGERAMGITKEEHSRAPIHVARFLTRKTGVTMRALRLVRWCRMAARGLCSPPSLSPRESLVVLGLSRGAIYVAPARGP
jgi:hypothetical protein